MWPFVIVLSILVPLVAPINVSAQMVNRTAVNISWIYPLDVNNPDDMSLLGGMIKGFYVIVFAPDSLHPPIVHRNYQGSIGTQYWDIVGNLTPGTTYHAQVKAFTKKGDGKPSVAYIFTVPKEDSRKSSSTKIDRRVRVGKSSFELRHRAEFCSSPSLAALSLSCSQSFCSATGSINKYHRL